MIKKYCTFYHFFAVGCPDVPYLGPGYSTGYTSLCIPGRRRYPVGTVVTVDCYKGYILVGNSTTTTCTSSGNFEPELSQNPCTPDTEQSR